MGWIHLAQDTDWWQAFVKMAMNPLAFKKW
jgi:hypothetical protein